MSAGSDMSQQPQPGQQPPPYAQPPYQPFQPAPPPRRANPWKWIVIGCGGLIALSICGTIAATTGLVALLSGGGSTSTPSATTVAAGVSGQATATVALATAAGTRVASPAGQVAPPATGNRGINFGKPVVFNAAGLNTVAVPVTNTTELVKSFTVKATWRNGEQIAATASGAVNDLRPGQMRAVTLISQTPIPTGVEPRIDVDTMIIETRTTPGADAAAKMTFGPPKVTVNAGLTTVDVEVTNGDNKIHSFTVQIMFMQGDQLVGVATGAVNDLEAGQTKTASLITQGSTEGAEPRVAVETLVK